VESAEYHDLFHIDPTFVTNAIPDPLNTTLQPNLTIPSPSSFLDIFKNNTPISSHSSSTLDAPNKRHRSNETPNADAQRIVQATFSNEIDALDILAGVATYPRIDGVTQRSHTRDQLRSYPLIALGILDERTLEELVLEYFKYHHLLLVRRCNQIDDSPWYKPLESPNLDKTLLDWLKRNHS
jgi:hypothetical protein